MFLFLSCNNLTISPFKETREVSLKTSLKGLLQCINDAFYFGFMKIDFIT